MYLNLITGRIESSQKSDDIVCPNMNENNGFSLTKIIDELLGVPLENCLESYDDELEDRF